MRRNRPNLLASFLIILASVVGAYLFYLAAKHTSGNDALQAIYENLSADILVIAFTLTVIDAWTRIRDHREYESTEQQTIRDVQERVFICLSVVKFQLRDTEGEPDDNSENLKSIAALPEKIRKSASYNYLMYVGAKAGLEKEDFSKISVAIASEFLRQVQSAANDIDKTIITYEKSLQGTSFRTLREIHRKLDLIASPGLQLIAQGVGLAGLDKNSKILGKRGASALTTKVNELIVVGKMAEDLSSMLG